MSKYYFTIIASGLDPEAEDFEDRFFAAGCDDATLSVQRGAIILEFSREAKSFPHALVSAFSDVQKAGAKVVHFEPDHLVSLSDIAHRSDMSKAAISLFAKGERGRDFPSPVAKVTSESPLWDWVEVARWMFRRKSLSLHHVVEARIVRQANVALTKPDGIEKFFAQRFRSEIRA
ncbi:hypothetical protein [Bradyrhizobium sp. G127]|uniref:hypothetical protein n=1 Tax=Bradyrhizobium sp. G127 TaxID=2904800 RepID=UPI001F3B0A9A|nr:hypothetical protein [Bradyrhizobium sp. G127]MCF2523005.1 hypothetical protein [Bradyrhizobium sp. G127]